MILFLISLVVLCGMIASKVFETRFNKVHFLSSLFMKGDRIIHQLIDELVFMYNRYKKIGRIFVFEFLPSYLYELLVKAKDFVAKKYYNAGDSFRGRRMLKSNGSVSFFLERLAEKKAESEAHRF